MQHVTQQSTLCVYYKILLTRTNIGIKLNQMNYNKLFKHES